MDVSWRKKLILRPLRSSRSTILSVTTEYGDFELISNVFVLDIEKIFPPIFVQLSVKPLVHYARLKK